MINNLNSIDTKLFLFLNSLHSPYLDPIMYWFSDKWIWLPMYLFIAIILVWRFKNQGFMIIFFIGILILICDQTASNLIKNTVQRLRPSHEPTLTGLIHLSKAGPGGLYGFLSSHATNAFGLATFLLFVLDEKFRILKYWLVTWAVLVAYSRIYNGVHYPGYVIAGSFLGIAIGSIMSILYKLYLNKYKHIKK